MDSMNISDVSLNRDNKGACGAATLGLKAPSTATMPRCFVGEKSETLAIGIVR